MNLDPQNNIIQTNINIGQDASDNINLSESDNDNCEYDGWFSDFPIF